MPQRCTVCAHPDTKDIEKEIVQGRAHTQIAKKYGLDHQAVRYHKLNHLPETLIRSTGLKRKTHAENILGGIEELLSETETILKEARQDGHNRLALDAIKEGRNTYELLSKIAVKLREYQQVDQKKNEHHIQQQLQKGLEALSDEELIAWNALLHKVLSANSEEVLSEEARQYVRAENEARHERSQRVLQGDSDQNSPSKRFDEDKNTQKEGEPDDLDLDDWEEDWELELDDLDLGPPPSNEIPSEETDPPWLKERRKRRR